jgi:hypothetical protein
MSFKYRIWIWLLVALLVPIGIFIYEGGYNADAMLWIVGVATLAIVYEVIFKVKRHE